MKIQVDFYKPLGKWYAGGEVEIGDIKPYDPAIDLLDVIWQNQQILSTKRSNYFTIVTNDTSENHNDPNYRHCFKFVLQIGIDIR